MNMCSLPDNHHDQYRTISGFTLVEVMVVIMIIGVMAAITIPIVVDKPDVARFNSAKSNIKTISSALQLYHLQYGRYPTTEEGLQQLVRGDKPLPPGFPDLGYLDKDDLIDPWGNDYVYVSPGEFGPFDLTCLGKDGVSGGEGVRADITNW